MRRSRMKISASFLWEGGRVRMSKITDRGTECWVKSKVQNYDQSNDFKIDREN